MNTQVWLNNNMTRLVKFICKLENIVFIEFVDLETRLGKILFYIFFVKTSFLFCLAAIDKYRTFFNDNIN